MPENFSHVRSGGRGKRRASSRPTGSQEHIRIVGCYLEPVAGENGRAVRTTIIIPPRVFAIWRVSWHIKGKGRQTRDFPFLQESEARRYSFGVGGYVERIKVTEQQ